MEDKSPQNGGPRQGGPPPEQKPGPQRPRMSTSTMWLLLVLLIAAGALLWMESGDDRSTITYSFFREQLEKGNIAKVHIQGQYVTGEFKEAPLDPDAPPPEKTEETAEGEPAELNEKFDLYLSPLVGEELDKELRAKGVRLAAKPPSDGSGLMMFFWFAIMGIFIFFMWSTFRRTRDQFMGGGLFSGFTKSPAKRYDASKEHITFVDVAGLEGVKADLEELVEFLKNPERFQRLGGRVPKGVLLMGPPGTGKTLLARAVAGEAGVPFFSISGSEFIQMFVGVGAGRVRDLFKTAKDNSPAILFIDEIDAVGRQRGAGLGGGHDEREQTLNQILSEMDGFTQSESVIVLAATNRPDVLDPALLRPGRFDRHITVDRPSQKGRKEIFKVHMRDVSVADDLDLDRLAHGTVGLTGADIRNLVNEAALWATRQGKEKVDMSDFEYARDKILMGPKREEVLAGKEKTMTAYHEAGHALLAWILPEADPLHKVTIIPRGRALGVTQLIPEEDRLNIGESNLHSRLVFMLGGRAAEKLVFDEYSAGAENDLKEATKIARKMVSHWGMSDRIGPVAYNTGEEHPFLGREMAHEHREFSEHTAQIIDEEITRILNEASTKARDLLAENRGKLDQLAGTLEEKEMLDRDEIEDLIGPPANARLKSGAKGESPLSGDGRAEPAKADTEGEPSDDSARTGSDAKSESASGNGADPSPEAEERTAAEGGSTSPGQR